MKKLTYLSTLAAAALLTACSSDTPDMPQPVNGKADSSDMMYMSLRINTPTRAESLGVDGGTEKASALENHINDVTIFICDASGCLWSGTSNLNTDGTDGSGNSVTADAIFQVPKGIFDTLTGKATEELTFYAVCNQDVDLVTPNEDETITTLYSTVDNKTTNFVMSGCQDIEVLEPTTEKDGSSSDKAWIMTKESLHVDRVAAKMTYSYSGTAGEVDDEVTYYTFTASDGTDKKYTDNKGMTFAVYGSQLHLENVSAYLYPHVYTLAESATTPTGPAFGKGVQSTSDVWFASILKTFSNADAFGTGAYDLKDVQYTFPRTNNLVSGATLKDVVYVSFQAKFDVPSTHAAYKYMHPAGNAKATETLYSYNHVLIGSIKDFETFSGDNADVVKYYYNQAKKDANGSKAGEVVTDAEIAAALEAYCGCEAGYGLFAFTPDTNGDYWCYYYKPIYDKNDKDANDGVRYAVVRNHLYEVKVNSINGIGYPAGETPTDLEEKEPEFGWFDITIEANPWQVRQNYFDF